MLERGFVEITEDAYLAILLQLGGDPTVPRELFQEARRFPSADVRCFIRSETGDVIVQMSEEFGRFVQTWLPMALERNRLRSVFSPN